MRVFLIGYMGVGKTTLGKQLAQKLAYAFVDTDAMVTALEGKPVKEVFAARGEAYFRKKEQECLHRLAKRDNLVIATGGGIPCFYDNMDWMNAHGHTVYLYMTAEGLYQRLKNEREERPLISAYTADELYDFISNSLQSREAFYLKSRTVFEADQADISVLAGVLKLSDNP